MKNFFIAVIVGTCFLILARPSYTAVITGETATLYPADDATVSENNPDLVENSNFLKIGNSYIDGSIYEQWSYAQFDLSNIPDNATITSATIRWYIFGYVADVNSSNRYIDFWHVADDNWDENTLTWNNKPDFDDSAGWMGKLTPTTYIGYYSFYMIPLASGATDWITPNLPDNLFSFAMNTPHDDYSKNFMGYSGNLDAFFLELTYDYDDAIASASTLPATSVSDQSAVLNGNINPNNLITTCSFEYGTDTTYGTAADCADALNGTSDIPVSLDIHDLSSSTTYHYRVIATNDAGTAYGADQTFTTLGLCGDIDKDEDIDLEDLVKALRVMAGVQTGSDIGGDCDANGRIDFIEIFSIIENI